VRRDHDLVRLEAIERISDRLERIRVADAARGAHAGPLQRDEAPAQAPLRGGPGGVEI
jgi:hypothetical protein